MGPCEIYEETHITCNTYANTQLEK